MKPLVINPQGTSGSGKTTLVKRILAHYPNNTPHHLERRKQPICNVHHGRSNHPDLMTVGHYNSPTGGADTVPSMDMIFEWVRKGLEQGHDVLVEGLLMSGSSPHAIKLHEDYPDTLAVIHLTTPLDLCLESVQARRAARGKTDPLNPKNTQSKFRAAQGRARNLAAKGIVVHSLDREEAYHTAMAILSQRTLNPGWSK